MTLRARALGMTRSTFTNASGLPDPDAWTTARDLALLARRLVADFPGYYHYFSTPGFVFHGQVVFNHDNLLKSYPGADGLKTGYTLSSGHNLVTSAVRGGTRLIGVELGCATNVERDAQMAQLLNAGFIERGIPVSDRPLLAAARSSRLPSLISGARAAQTDRRMEARWHRLPQLRTAMCRAPGRSKLRLLKRACPAAPRWGRAEPRRSNMPPRMAATRWRTRVLGLAPAKTSGACHGVLEARVLHHDPGRAAPDREALSRENYPSRIALRSVIGAPMARSGSMPAPVPRITIVP